MKGCARCGTELQGRRRRFCSIKCKQSDINNRLQSYSMQQQRGRQRKLHLIRQLGGACQRCGYMRNHAAIAFHHRSPESKSSGDMVSAAVEVGLRRRYVRRTGLNDD